MLYIIYIGKEIPRTFLTVIFVCACFLNLSFAQTDTASRVQRSEVILEKEQALREKINEPQKTYIRKIAVEGASLLGRYGSHDSGGA